MRQMQVFTRTHGSEREHFVVIGSVSRRFKGDFGTCLQGLNKAFKYRFLSCCPKHPCEENSEVSKKPRIAAGLCNI